MCGNSRKKQTRAKVGKSLARSSKLPPFAFFDRHTSAVQASSLAAPLFFWGGEQPSPSRTGCWALEGPQENLIWVLIWEYRN